MSKYKNALTNFIAWGIGIAISTGICGFFAIIACFLLGFEINSSMFVGVLTTVFVSLFLQASAMPDPPGISTSSQDNDYDDDENDDGTV